MKLKKSLFALGIFYLLLGSTLLLLPVFKSDLYEGSDEKFHGFPLAFGLIFLLFSYRLLSKKRIISDRYILLGSIVISALIMSLTGNQFSNNPFTGLLLNLSVNIIFGSIAYLGFLYTWVPYIVGWIVITKLK